MEEIWKDIEGYEGIYQVSSLGRVKSLERFDSSGHKRKERLLKPEIQKGKYKKGGYERVTLCKYAKTKHYSVHQLVAMAFLGHKPCGSEVVVDHINNNPLDNRLENLQLTTPRHNSSKDKSGYTSEYIGVCVSDNKYASNILIESTPCYLGRFKNEKIAHSVYLYALENKHLFNGCPKEFRKALGYRGCKQSSKFKNVYLHTQAKRFVGSFNHNKKFYHVGIYDTEEEAYNAVNEKRKALGL